MIDPVDWLAWLPESVSVASFFALIAAMLFATASHIISLALRDLDSRTCSMINIFGSVVLYWLLVPFLIDWSWMLTGAVVIFLSIGLFRPLLSSNLANAGNKMLGPTLSTTITATTPFFAIIMGVTFLNEKLSFEVGLGAVLVFVGVIIIATRRKSANKKDDEYSDWPWWALLLPVGAAFFRALAHMLTKVGMLIVPSAFFAGLLSYSVSFAVALGSDVFRKTPTLERIKSRGTKYAIISGVMNGVAIGCLNNALKLGDLVEVAPVASCSPVFTLLLSWLVFKRETLTLRLVLAVVLVVSGVVLVTLRGLF